MGQIDFSFKHRGARERLLELLRDQRWHRWDELEEVAGNRFGARIHELRKEGWQIIDTPDDEDGQRYQLASLTRGVRQPDQVRVYISAFCAEQAARTGTLTEQARENVKRALDIFKSRRNR